MSRKSKQSVTRFKFKKHHKIGAVDAQEDEQFLQQCFVDNGELDILSDTGAPECILLGRTGVGKTALLSMLEKREEKVAVLSPFDLALNHLSNNQALQFYMDIGIDLDLFFRVLWRHVLAIELIKLAGSSSGEQRINHFFQRIQSKVYTNRSRKMAQEYLAKYTEFWKDTEILIKEETETLEKEVDKKIGSELNAKIPGVSSVGLRHSLRNSNKLSHEEKIQVAQIGQQVVNKRQMRELSAVIRLLRDELLYDRQKRYFITIDKLDESWTNNLLRYKLIRALIETIRDFNAQINQLKIICAIREDLLDRAFRFTRNQGDQQEKYQSLYLQLYWTSNQLVDVIENRINQLIAHQYVRNQRVKIKDILPSRVQKSNSVDYIIARTLHTPRDVIMLFNECIKQAEGRAKINQPHILTAEGIYSESRLKALADEWSADYPTLGDAVYLLKRIRKTFRIPDLEEEAFDDQLLDYYSKNHQNHGKGYIIYDLIEEKMNFAEIIPELLQIFYQVGIVGIKKETYLEIYWSHKGNKISTSDITGDVRFHIHPAFYRVLGINP